MADPIPVLAGLRSPMQPTGAGGFELSRGDDHLIQLIRDTVGDGDSDNPFQELGFIETVFQIQSDQGWRGQLRLRIDDFFKRLERANLAKLRSVTFDELEVEGETPLRIIFQSLESNTDLEVATTVRRV